MSAVSALTAVPRDLTLYRAVTDEALLHLTRLAADEVRLAQLHVSMLAGEIARRSAPELGHSGLAQRTGHRTPEEMVRVTTGTRVTDARAAVRVGTAVSSSGSDGSTPLGDAVLSGQVSVAVADAVRTGLGRPAGAITQAMLDDAAEALLARVGALDPDRAAREARAARDELDVEGIADREEHRRAQRSFRLSTRRDGMGIVHWVLDPQTLAVVGDVVDRVTSPRRTEPHFQTDAERRNTAQRSHPALSDERSVEQRASDTIAELLRQGAAADTSLILGGEPVGVRIVTAARAEGERSGPGWIEGQPDPVSGATVERIACAAGTVVLTVDGDPATAGQPLNLGREKRLFSRAQRLALAVRDGGCRWPGCERPPSWCEAHHIDHWHRDGGRTDIADGLLLCRHHHLLAHNNGWEIERAGPSYHLIPPPRGGTGGGVGTEDDSRDDARREQRSPIDMPSVSPALRHALRA